MKRLGILLFIPFLFFGCMSVSNREKQVELENQSRELKEYTISNNCNWKITLMIYQKGLYSQKQVFDVGKDLCKVMLYKDADYEIVLSSPYDTTDKTITIRTDDNNYWSFNWSSYTASYGLNRREIKYTNPQPSE